MHTTSGLLTYLDHTLGRLGTSMLVALGLVLALVAVLVVAAAAGLLGSPADPTQVAPVRWIYRA